jgi:hypothetical protein
MLFSFAIIVFLSATAFLVPWGVVYEAEERIIALIGSFWIRVYCHDAGSDHTRIRFTILANLLNNCEEFCGEPAFKTLVC